MIPIIDQNPAAQNPCEKFDHYRSGMTGGNEDFPPLLARYSGHNTGADFFHTILPGFTESPGMSAGYLSFTMSRASDEFQETGMDRMHREALNTEIYKGPEAREGGGISEGIQNPEGERMYHRAEEHSRADTHNSMQGSRGSSADNGVSQAHRSSGEGSGNVLKAHGSRDLEEAGKKSTAMKKEARMDRAGYTLKRGGKKKLRVVGGPKNAVPGKKGTSALSLHGFRNKKISDKVAYLKKKGFADPEKTGVKKGKGLSQKALIAHLSLDEKALKTAVLKKNDGEKQNSKAGNWSGKKKVGKRTTVHTVKLLNREILSTEREAVADFDSISKPKTGKNIFGILEKYDNTSQSAEIKRHYQIHKIADGNFEEIIRQFTFVVNKGGGEARLQLQPESLGTLRMKIKLNHNEVHTNIIVDNQAVKDLIMSKLNHLEENLLRQGFHLGSFEVEVKDQNKASQGSYREIKKGRSIQKIDHDGSTEEVSSVRSASLPWISTIVNITV